MPDTANQMRRPIGFWLKLVDQLIDTSLDELLASRDLTRRHWQILNVLQNGGGTLTEIDNAVKPFLTEDEPSGEPVLAALKAAGWATTQDGRWELPAGRQLEFAALQSEIARQREKIAAGISPAEYQTAVTVLERMASNLGWKQETS